MGERSEVSKVTPCAIRSQDNQFDTLEDEQFRRRVRDPQGGSFWCNI